MGDAFTTDSNFVNQLGLNGTLTLIDAAKSRFGEDRANIWKPTVEQDVATQTVRDLLLTLTTPWSMPTKRLCAVTSSRPLTAPCRSRTS